MNWHWLFSVICVFSKKISAPVSRRVRSGYLCGYSFVTDFFQKVLLFFIYISNIYSIIRINNLLIQQ